MKSENWTDLDDGKVIPQKYYLDLTSEFPSLKRKIESWGPEMIHFRMEAFADYTIEQIESKNYSELKRCFEFQESRIVKMNSELINALNISYCESLLLGKCANEMTEVKQLMPPKLKKAYTEYEEYYSKMRKAK